MYYNKVMIMKINDKRCYVLDVEILLLVVVVVVGGGGLFTDTELIMCQRRVTHT